MEGDRFNVLRHEYELDRFNGPEVLSDFYITDRLSQEGISSPESMGHAVVKTKSVVCATVLCKFMNASCSEIEPLPSIFSGGDID